MHGLVSEHSLDRCQQIHLIISMVINSMIIPLDIAIVDTESMKADIEVIEENQAGKACDNPE